MNRASWLGEAGWGVFFHYLAIPASTMGGEELSASEWNSRVNSFHAELFAETLADCGVPYCFFTLGQNSGFYDSPNQTFDRIVGRKPSRLSERDLIADVADALALYNIPLLVYLPSHAPASDRLALEKLGCTPRWDASRWQLKPGLYLDVCRADERLTQFQRNWEEIIAEYSVRWGKKVKGWWFDGCYYFQKMYCSDVEPNMFSFAAAARRGNPDSIVAFNNPDRNWSGYMVSTEAEDYTAGELGHIFPLDCIVPEKNRQLHYLSFLGEKWGYGMPRFQHELAVGITKRVNQFGGAMTWDVPLTYEGVIGDEMIAQLKIIRDACGEKSSGKISSLDR